MPEPYELDSVMEAQQEVLLRLFRCMSEGERASVIECALEEIGARCEFNSLFVRTRKSEVEFDPANLDDLNSRLRSAWPAEWPGRDIVDLDFVGDPGAWLELYFPEPLSDLFCYGSIQDLRSLAEQLAVDYLESITDQGFPLPSDFIESSGNNIPPHARWSIEDQEMMETELLAFLRYWRESVLQTIESQNEHQNEEPNRGSESDS